MSAFINDKGEFTKFYGSSIISLVKNVRDLEPLLSVLNNNPNVKISSQLHLKIFDIFSQTLASFINDECKVVKKWFEQEGGSYKPYQYLDYTVILPTHYEAKKILKKIMPQNFCIVEAKIKIRNDKVIAEFEFSEEHKNQFKKIVKYLNDLYGVRRGITKYIVLGYLKSSPFEFTKIQLDLLNSLVPKKIYIHSPDIYQYNNVDNFKLYSSDMN